MATRPARGCLPRQMATCPPPPDRREKLDIRGKGPTPLAGGDRAHNRLAAEVPGLAHPLRQEDQELPRVDPASLRAALMAVVGQAQAARRSSRIVTKWSIHGGSCAQYLLLSRVPRRLPRTAQERCSRGSPSNPATKSRSLRELFAGVPTRGLTRCTGRRTRKVVAPELQGKSIISYGRKT